MSKSFVAQAKADAAQRTFAERNTFRKAVPTVAMAAMVATSFFAAIATIGHSCTYATNVTFLPDTAKAAANSKAPAKEAKAK